MCSQPATVAPETTDGLRDLLVSYARHGTPMSIAVVGNAPMAPDAARAAAIDDADLVVRMTSFAVDTPGRPPSLGRRCDVVALHRGVLASPYTFADYQSRLYLLVEPGRLHWESETLPRWWPADLGFVPVPNRRYTVPMVRLLGFDATQEVWPTTGTLATYVMTELFPTATVLLTGMSIVDEPDQVTFRHAWGAPVKVTPEHRLSAEAELLRRWHASGRIHLLP
jgi:hypothetical protein